jgi:hypothetical protein
MKIPFLSQFLNSEADMKSGAPKITYDSSVSAGQKTRFGALLTNIRHELPDLLAVSVVELRSGKLLATHHIAGKLAPGKAAGKKNPPHWWVFFLGPPRPVVLYLIMSACWRSTSRAMARLVSRLFTAK